MPSLKLAYSKRSLAPGENPMSLFERVRDKSAFLLQSGQGNFFDMVDPKNIFSKKFARYSFIGYHPFAKVWSHHGVTHLLKMKDFLDWKKSTTVQMFDGDPLHILRDLARHFHFNGTPPVPFCGGIAGYFSYDFGTEFVGTVQKVFDDLNLPDFEFFFVDKVLAIDHETSELCFLALASTDLEAERKLDEMSEDLQSAPAFEHAGTIGEIRSNLSYEQYSKKMMKIHHYLEEGDTYQVNFSQRFSAECTRDPWVIYKLLTQTNPAPYGCFFDFEDFQILSSSPELLLSKNGSNVLTKPIKGTIPRGKNLQEDKRNITQLLASEKDNAELAMIVDLERNDLGKICEAGSIHVVSHRDVEKYARVIHTVSTIEGHLQHNKDFFDAFEALFPGGSITGCPKKRTMEIIDELEDFKRGVYTGSAGYLGFDGNGAVNILIRTMLLQDGKLYYQAGGGIVIDSAPRQEFDESLQKAMALREALIS